MGKKKFSVSRLVYGLVGVAAIVGLVQLLWTGSFGLMSWWEIVLISLLLVGGFNWGIVALTGDKDLLKLLGL